MEGDRLDVLQEFCLEEDEIFFLPFKNVIGIPPYVRTFIYIYIIIKSISTHVHSINSTQKHFGIEKSELKFI